jgi:predicted DsbA family dithiol-disulfide isomerase
MFAEMSKERPKAKTVEDKMTDATEIVYQAAVRAELDRDALARDLASDSMQAVLDSVVITARRYGVAATPTLIINGYRVRGAKDLGTYRAILGRILGG